ncbi:transcriptional regulator with AbiEi antitoxin domain of type IV toxin-antitoxin system [Methylosinus sp. sav-2]|jgi:predicted transcriptional regulator of viral defense system|uniref:type IV toxin-antitoxin system AbiEi family antitoxin domain-containing protein n=1 Tax=Methylosinus sp. sav-2 TaxID=2485168 RepID=UPI0006922966|nr:type IV toxin-antitoxin system AbiEi family antitoxin domain-containing protein [Methylosinus sp. sav-2]TDX60532.1 transcriptional regulator with AbiEi antitoxin domain of type IV toxin-antitoxin system [Methylosinus sp. sav-2]
MHLTPAIQAKNLRELVLAVARDRGIARSRDFEAAGVPRIYLQRLRDEGLLTQPGRGLYALAGGQISAHHSLAEAAKAVPSGVIGLLSALQYHELTTQLPSQVWMLLPSKAWAPRRPPVTLKILRASGEALKAGVEQQLVDRVVVPITSPAKTVADCFKYRSKIGLDVAIEALRDCLTKKRATRDEIWRYAAIDRVQNVMRPYLEALS